MKTGKNLIEFNTKGGVFAVGSTVSTLGYLSSITLDRSVSSTSLYGDGEIQYTLVTDSGSTGSLEMTARDAALEEALGFTMAITSGTAEIEVVQNKTINVGFESQYIDDSGVKKTKKTWLYGVTISPASDSLSQNTDTVNNNSVSYALTIVGVNLKASDGETDYVDSNGNTLKVWKLSSVPTDTGYSTFLASVPTPTVKSSS